MSLFNCEVTDVWLNTSEAMLILCLSKQICQWRSAGHFEQFYALDTEKVIS